MYFALEHMPNRISYPDAGWEDELFDASIKRPITR